jgi:hypothetical protein
MRDLSAKNGYSNGYSGGPTATAAPYLPSLGSISLRAVLAEEKTALILQLLREAAQKSRDKKSQPFYSIRAVANHFAVPPTTVSRIYTRLKDEGLLASVWGSKTFVEPVQIDKQLHFRAVVGLPASLRLFCTVPAYRTLFLSVRDALWGLGFAARLVFYEGRDAEESTFADLLLSYKIDVVIWFLPSPKTRNTTARLVDRGIRLITVVDSLRSFSEPCYYLRREPALKEGLSAWRRDGITSAVVVRQASCESFERFEMIETCLREVGMHYTIANIDSRVDFSRALSPRKNRAIIVPSSELLIQLVSRDPVRLGKLFEQSRVTLIEGLVDAPLCTWGAAAFDVIEFDWPTVAKRIACNLLGPVRSTTDNPVTFEARWLSSRRSFGKKPLASANHSSR